MSYRCIHRRHHWSCLNCRRELMLWPVMHYLVGALLLIIIYSIWS